MSDLSIFELATEFCHGAGVIQPDGLIAYSDTNSYQFLALIRQLGRLMARFTFQQSKKRITFTSVANEVQGSVQTVFGADYRALIPGTFWDETLRRPLMGPPGDASWEMYKAFTNPGPLYQYMLMQNQVRILPTLPAGHTLAAMIYSKYGFTDSTGTTYKNMPTADTDKYIWPDETMLQGLSWLWKQAKGEEWESDKAEWYSMVSKDLVKDTGTVVKLDYPLQSPRPGIIIPAGNWAHS